jgi:hypothetical protein
MFLLALFLLLMFLLFMFLLSMFYYQYFITHVFQHDSCIFCRLKCISVVIYVNFTDSHNFPGTESDSQTAVVCPIEHRDESKVESCHISEH